MGRCCGRHRRRSDYIETPEIIRQRLEPTLALFTTDRLLLTSECGFGHVPLEITHAKLRLLTHTCEMLRQ
ncbi:MAG TPA: hypothetical protein VNJ09_09245 [Chthonomonadales bacterium]|nr:hypothetical protein [Chthonomonadales bacterium]